MGDDLARSSHDTAWSPGLSSPFRFPLPPSVRSVYGYVTSCLRPRPFPIFQTHPFFPHHMLSVAIAKEVGRSV